MGGDRAGGIPAGIWGALLGILLFANKMRLSKKLNFEALTKLLALDQAGRGLHKISPWHPVATRHRGGASVRELLRQRRE